MLLRMGLLLLAMVVPRVLPPLFRYARLVWRLTFDRRVSLFLRALLPLALLYVISPIDLVRDNVPILGRADDVIVVCMALLLLIKLAPRDIVDEHLGRSPRNNIPQEHDPSQVVDGTSRFIDED